MTVTAEAGPQIIYGYSQTSSGAVTEYNEQRGPSLNDLGQSIMDPRPPYAYYPGSPVSQVTRGFWNGYAAIDTIPGTVSTNCIAATQVPTSMAYNVTLVTSNQGVIVTPGVSLTPPEGGATVTGLLGIDMGPTVNNSTGLAAITYGSAGTIGTWDPRNMCARVVSWSGSSNSSGIESLSVAGRDVYGYKMTETIPSSVGSTGAAVLSFKGKKAFKYISAVTFNSTATFTSTNLIVGVADVYGFPMRVDHPAYTSIWWGTSSAAGLIVTSSIGHTLASTGTAGVMSSTTGDVRGTFTSSTASSTANTFKLVAMITPSAQNLPNSFGDTTGYFGIAQYSSV